MPEVSYVYPNLSQTQLKCKTQRGGLPERWRLAQKTKCEYVEVPGTLIKNKTEERLTGLEIGDFLSEKEIELLYDNEPFEADVKYCLHTEPSLSKPNKFGRKIQPEIKWYDSEWSEKYREMVIQMMNYIGKPAEIIEIHPGYKKNSYEDIARLISSLLDSIKGDYSFQSLILLENRTEQFISRGKDIAEYWDFMKTNYPSLIDFTGIVLDVQQLHTRTKNKFKTEYDLIPLDSLKGFHIHTKHRWPSIHDSIPWMHVFGRIRKIEHKIIINPEIHQKKRVNQSIQFCEDLLSFE